MRAVYGRLAVAIIGLTLSAFAVGCNAPAIQPNDTITDESGISEPNADSYDSSVPGQDFDDRDAGEVDEIGSEPASDHASTARARYVTFHLSPHGRLAKRLSEFLKGRSTLATDTATAVSIDDFRGSGTAVLTFTEHRAGSACMSFTGTTSHVTQELKGGFTMLGGTRDGARLHAKGIFRAVERVPGSGRWMATIYPTAVSLGSSRRLPKSCGQAAKLSAMFDGFAFAPSSAGHGTLPAGTTIYPAGSTVSGNVGCGAADNLYAILSYSGPSGATAGVNYFSGSSKGGSNVPARVGKNNYLLVSAPSNGNYNAIITISRVSYPSALFTEGLTVSRSC